jgi:hypothetical protein
MPPRSTTTQVCLTLDNELLAHIDATAEFNGLSRAAIIRDLLRRAVETTPTERSLGWREGYNACCAALKETVQRAVMAVPTIDPAPVPLVQRDPWGNPLDEEAPEPIVLPMPVDPYSQG